MTAIAEIQWRKCFDVAHAKGHFRMFVSEHNGGSFFASILYYVPKQFANACGFIEFKLKTIPGKSEDEAIKLLKQWIDDNLGKDYSLQEGDEVGRF